MSEPLSQREFHYWREGDSEFKTQVLAHLESQRETNLTNENRLTRLESHKEKSDTRTATISSIVSAIVGGVVGALSSRVW